MGSGKALLYPSYQSDNISKIVKHLNSDGVNYTR